MVVHIHILVNHISVFITKLNKHRHVHCDIYLYNICICTYYGKVPRNDHIKEEYVALNVNSLEYGISALV